MKKIFNFCKQNAHLRQLMLIPLYVVLFSCFTGFVRAAKYQQLVLKVLPFFSLPLLGVCILRLRSRRCGAFVLAYLAWVLITCLSRGLSSFSMKVNQLAFIEQCTICCVALPFAHLSGDSGRKHLDRFLFVIVSVVAVCIWLCLLGTFTGREIVIWRPALRFGATYTSTGRLMLRVLDLHYYHLGYLAVICFFCTLYLAAAHRSSRLLPLWLLLMLTFAAAVLLTYSRTGVFALLAGLLLAFHMLLQRICPRRILRRVIFLCVILAGVFLTGAGMDFIYKAVHSIRDIWHGLSTLSSRTEIWSGGILALLKHPYALVFGFPLDTVMITVNESIPLEDFIAHMHSGFMQVLVSLGLPGLLMVLLFFAVLGKRCWRLFFAAPADSSGWASKFLILIPFTAVLINAFEGILLYGQSGQILLSVITAMVSGYLLDENRMPE